MHTIQHNIDVHRQTITKYVVDHSIFVEYQGADRRYDSVPGWWWWEWEQKMRLDDV
jgi:hypothetical protein